MTETSASQTTAETPLPSNLPWSPLYTVTRSGQPELTVHGLIYVWAEDRKLYANAGRSLLKVGDFRFPLWTRSLLKPWQLMAIYPTLKTAYPPLTSRHFAMLMASQQGDGAQLDLLAEIMEIGGFTEEHLQCPACAPFKKLNDKLQPSRLNHPCCGKHLGHLLYLQAKNLPLNDYLNPDNAPYQALRELLGYLLNRDMEREPVTVDGCGMPNYAMSAVEIAQLYHALVMPISRDMLRQAPDELTDILTAWNEISALMREYPDIIGGEDRLDTRLMQGRWLQDSNIPLIAKEGADGLLAVGLGHSEIYPDGLGVLIKLASGYDPSQLKVIIVEILRQLQLSAFQPGSRAEHLNTHFHFQMGVNTDSNTGATA